MNLLVATAAFTFLATAFFGDKSPSEKRAPKETIRVLPVGRTPEPSTAALAIAIPRDGAALNGNPVWVQLRVDGYTLGSDSQFGRADELVNSEMGQTVHVVVDDLPYFPVNEPAIDPFNEDGFYYDMSYKFQLPFRLKEGAHTLRLFLARSFGESLKGERVFQAINFSIGDSNGSLRDLSGPYVTYNEPSDNFDLVESKPVLLDFFISNCELSPDGYKVRVSVDGK